MRETFIDEGYKNALLYAIENYKKKGKLSQERIINCLEITDIIERVADRDTLSLAIAIEDYCLEMKTGLKLFGWWFSTGSSKLLENLTAVFREYPKVRLLELYIKKQETVLRKYGALDKMRLQQEVDSLKKLLEDMTFERDQLKSENEHQALELETVRSVCSALNLNVLQLEKKNEALKAAVSQLSEDFKQFKEMFFRRETEKYVENNSIEDEELCSSSLPTQMKFR